MHGKSIVDFVRSEALEVWAGRLEEVRQPKHND